MFKILIPAAFLSVLLFSCKGGDAEKRAALNEAPYTLTFAEAYAEEPDCDGDTSECTYAKLKLPLLSAGDPETAGRINADVDALVRAYLKERLPEPEAMGSLDDLAESFVEGYTLYTMEFPDGPGKWYFEARGDSSALLDDRFVLHLTFDEYMGGAHPNAHTVLKNYSLADGEPLSIAEFTDIDALRKRAEKAFRWQFGLKRDDDLNDRGFMFEDGVFTLPENIALTPRGYLLIYNPYEVSSYAEGEIRMLLPYEKKEEAEEPAV